MTKEMLREGKLNALIKKEGSLIEVANRFYCGAVMLFVNKYKESGANIENVNEVSNMVVAVAKKAPKKLVNSVHV